MSGVISVAGAAIVLLVLRDIFRTLWYPTGRGTLTRVLMSLVWRVSRRWRWMRAGGAAGPLAMVTVVLSWAALVVIGGAMIYGPHIPEGFGYATGLDPDDRSPVVDAIYLSTVTVATLGFGDIVPRVGRLRLVAPLQALVGFVLLTAAVSWVLQVYPALARRRSLALKLSLLRNMAAARGEPGLDPGMTAQLLHGLASDLVQIRVDLTQYPETYYYRDQSPDAALPAVLGHAVGLGRRHSARGPPR